MTRLAGPDALRRHRIGRLCEEASEQGGLLTPEDLAQLLFQLTPVVLDLLPASEREARVEGAKLREVKKRGRRLPLFLTQTSQQGGVLTNAEVALLLKRSPSTMSTYRWEGEQAHQRLLPTSGRLHDRGPILTHKKLILEKLLFEGKGVPTVCCGT